MKQTTNFESKQQKGKKNRLKGLKLVDAALDYTY
jgi:hypothetical protein